MNNSNRSLRWQWTVRTQAWLFAALAVWLGAAVFIRKNSDLQDRIIRTRQLFPEYFRHEDSYWKEWQLSWPGEPRTLVVHVPDDLDVHLCAASRTQARLGSRNSSNVQRVKLATGIHRIQVQVTHDRLSNRDVVCLVGDQEVIHETVPGEPLMIGPTVSPGDVYCAVYMQSQTVMEFRIWLDPAVEN